MMMHATPSKWGWDDLRPLLNVGKRKDPEKVPAVETN